MEPFIQMTNVSKIYGVGDAQVGALKRLSLSIHRGEFAAIIGHSGSGKSTLMNLLGCLDFPTQGEYLLDGKPVAGLSDRQLSHIRNEQIGFVFQSFYLIPSLSALENVELPLLYRGIAREERRRMAMDSLCQVGLETRQHHRPAEMSGGQQQRVAIARAIAARPPLLLADEPTGNLDSQSGQDIMRILQQLHTEGHTIILITHDEDIAQSAARIIRVQDGKIAEDISTSRSA